MQKFFNTLAVFVGNLLRLKPSTWKSAEETSRLMTATALTLGETAVLKGDEQLVGVTPFKYLADCTLNALAFVVAVWIITQLVNAILVALPFLIGFAFVLWLLGKFGTPKGTTAVS